MKPYFDLHIEGRDGQQLSLQPDSPEIPTFDGLIEAVRAMARVPGMAWAHDADEPYQVTVATITLRHWECRSNLPGSQTVHHLHVIERDA